MDPVLYPSPRPPLHDKIARAASAHWVRGATRPAVLAVAAVLAIAGTVGFVSARVEFSPANPSPADPSQQAAHEAHPLLSLKLEDSSPETQLIRAYQQLAKGDEAAAFKTLERLVNKQPDFALAQLVYGDLLLARAGKVAPFGAKLAGESPEQAKAAAQLQTEAQLRLAALIERPPQDAVPAPLQTLSQATRHAIVVDASRARLYLFENGPEGLKLVKDSYVSIGKQGVDKWAEGDQKTPLGAYHVGVRRDEAAERYGAAALPLNYPNEYDRLQGRGGTSIWLHGERAGSYARSPQSTDGCIVLSNEDMHFLASTVASRETPVLVYKQVEWIKKKDARPVLDAKFEAAYRQWQQARVFQDAQTLRNFYEPGLERGSDSEARRLEQNLSLMARQALPVSMIEPLSLVPWKDKQFMIVVTYREHLPGDPNYKLKRQYWREHDGRWRIFFDGLVS